MRFGLSGSSFVEDKVVLGGRKVNNCGNSLAVYKCYNDVEFELELHAINCVAIEYIQLSCYKLICRCKQILDMGTANSYFPTLLLRFRSESMFTVSHWNQGSTRFK